MQKIGDVTDTADGNGEFTDGNVAGNVQPTELMAAWFTTVQREIIAVLTEAGIQPDKANDAQLVAAIKIILNKGIDGSGYLIAKNNLSDLADVAESRGHLGLGSLATKNSLTAAEVGALPVSAAALGVNLNTLGAYAHAGIYYQTANANATAANNYPVAEAGTLLVVPTAYGCQQEYTSFSGGRKFVRGLSASWNGKDGPWVAWTEILNTKTSDTRYYTKAQCDAGYQPKGSYAPAGQAYTKTESDGLYPLKTATVIGARVGARGSLGSGNGDTDIEAPIGNFITGRTGANGDVRYTKWYIRAFQINVNGTWKTITA